MGEKGNYGKGYWAQWDMERVLNWYNGHVESALDMHEKVLFAMFNVMIKYFCHVQWHEKCLLSHTLAHKMTLFTIHNDTIPLFSRHFPPINPL